MAPAGTLLDGRSGRLVQVQSRRVSPAGTVEPLPGGLTQTEWNAMTAAQRADYVAANAHSAQERQDLYLAMARQGISDLSSIIASVLAGETAKAQSQRDADAARARATYDLELAQIQANRDIAVAQANAQGRAVTPAPVATSPTLMQRWDGMGTAGKVGVSIAALGLVALGVAAVRK